MANMAYVLMTFTGPKERLKRFYRSLVDVVRKLESDDWDESILEGKEALYLDVLTTDIKDAFGLSDFEYRKYLYGDICDVSKIEGLSHNSSIYGTLGMISELREAPDDELSFEIAYSNAWVPCPEFWDVILRKFNAEEKEKGIDFDEHDIFFVFKAEEPGAGIFVNTDTYGFYYRDQYRLVVVEGDCTEKDFETDEELVAFLEDTYSVDLSFAKDEHGYYDFHKIEELVKENENVENCDIHEYTDWEA